jgi:hypothetical protein
MWRVTIQCSDDSWRIHGKTFKTIAEKYPATLLSSKQMPGGGIRLMSYQLEDVSDAEEFTDECQNLEGFTALFESL